MTSFIHHWSSIIISSNMFYNNTMSIMMYQMKTKRFMKICEINVTLSRRVLKC